MSPTLPPAVVSDAREALSRAGRQVLQALLPTALILAAGHRDGIDVAAVAILAAITAAVSLLRSVTGITVPATAPLAYQLADRAAVAAAGAALGYLVDGLTVQTHVFWGQLAYAAAGAAVTALIHYYVDPPVVSVSDARGVYDVSSLPDSVEPA
jgi:hypothetical protein